jgi:hypothetical protein
MRNVAGRLVLERKHGRDDRRTGKGAVVEIQGKGRRVNLEGAQWRMSNRGGPSSDNRVEVAFVDDAIAVRDSKNPTGPVLLFTQSEWDAFVEGAKDGEFDL